MLCNFYQIESIPQFLKLWFTFNANQWNSNFTLLYRNATTYGMKYDHDNGLYLMQGYQITLTLKEPHITMTHPTMPYPHHPPHIIMTHSTPMTHPTTPWPTPLHHDPPPPNMTHHNVSAFFHGVDHKVSLSVDNKNVSNFLNYCHSCNLKPTTMTYLFLSPLNKDFYFVFYLLQLFFRHIFISVR